MTPLARGVLELLPTEPGGASLEELAAELLGRRGPADRGRIRSALQEISDALGPLCVGRGDVPDLGRYRVKVYALRHDQAGPAGALLAAAPNLRGDDGHGDERGSSGPGR